MTYTNFICPSCGGTDTVEIGFSGKRCEIRCDCGYKGVGEQQ